MHIDPIALGIILTTLTFSLIMFIIIRSQSQKSAHPDAQLSNASEPTPLNHAPEGSHSVYSQSLLSLALQKPGMAEVGDGGGHGSRGEEGGKTRFKRRLFYEDTAEVVDGEQRRGVLSV